MSANDAEGGSGLATSRRCVVVGKPISHSLSPPMHNAGYAALGIADRFHFEHHAIEAAELPELVADIRRGAIHAACVTMPYKQTIMTHLDVITPAAQRADAVNTVYLEDGKVCGDNTDGIGWLRSLQANGVDVVDRRVVLFGAGGAAGPIIAVLLAEGVGHITIVNRDRTRAARLASRFNATITVCGNGDLGSVIHGDCLIINATPVGMVGALEAQSPVPDGLISAAMSVSDLVYIPRTTPLRRQAEAAGADFVEGLEMLAQQGAEQFRIFTGRDVDVNVLREAVVAALDSRS